MKNKNDLKDGLFLCLGLFLYGLTLSALSVHKVFHSNDKVIFEDQTGIIMLMIILFCGYFIIKNIIHDFIDKFFKKLTPLIFFNRFPIVLLIVFEFLLFCFGCFFISYSEKFIINKSFIDIEKHYILKKVKTQRIDLSNIKAIKHSLIHHSYTTYPSITDCVKLIFYNRKEIMLYSSGSRGQLDDLAQAISDITGAKLIKDI